MQLGDKVLNVSVVCRYRRRAQVAALSGMGLLELVTAAGWWPREWLARIPMVVLVWLAMMSMFVWGRFSGVVDGVTDVARKLGVEVER